MSANMNQGESYSHKSANVIDIGNTLPLLRQLYRLNRDSERGFGTVAEHIKNRGLKVLLKTRARQRAQFAVELQEMIEQSSGRTPRHGSLPATIHRGWIDLKSAMTIGRHNVEQVVLSETERGEAIASLKYQQALSDPLPETIRTPLATHAASIEASHAEITRLSGKLDGETVVQLFDNPDTAHAAIKLLSNASIGSDNISVADLSQVSLQYECDCHTTRLMESGMTGTLLGLAFGVLLGFLASIDTLLGVTAVNMTETVLITTGVGTLAGGLLGGLIGILIGQAVTEDDEYLYEQSLRDGNTLVTVHTANGNAQDIRRTLNALIAAPEQHK